MERTLGLFEGIYLAWDSDDNCLYIGTTKEPSTIETRLHRRFWGSEVALVTVEKGFSNYSEMCRRVHYLVKIFEPKYNRTNKRAIKFVKLVKNNSVCNLSFQAPGAVD